MTKCYSEKKRWDTAVLEWPCHFLSCDLASNALPSSLADRFPSSRLPKLKLECKYGVKSVSSILKKSFEHNLVYRFLYNISLVNWLRLEVSCDTFWLNTLI
jgi:hypothetical protein